MSKSMVPSKGDVLDMFSQGAGNIGLDEQSSSIIIANLNATTLPMTVGTPIDQIDTDDVTILFFMLDESPSMSSVEQAVIDGFNDMIIPALRGGSSRVVSTIEVGGLAFCERIRPLWGGGFQKLESLSTLTRKDYDTSRGSLTALYQAVLDGMTAVSVRSTEVVNNLGIQPKVICVVLSDGANNRPPHDAAQVKTVVDALSNEIFVKAFAGFETGEHVDFKQIAEAIGFGRPFEMRQNPGETDADIQRRFRHLVGVMSSSLITQHKSKVVAGSSSTFWQQP